MRKNLLTEQLQLDRRRGAESMYGTQRAVPARTFAMPRSQSPRRPASPRPPPAPDDILELPSPRDDTFSLASSPEARDEPEGPPVEALNEIEMRLPWAARVAILFEKGRYHDVLAIDPAEEYFDAIHRLRWFGRRRDRALDELGNPQNWKAVERKAAQCIAKSFEEVRNAYAQNITCPHLPPLVGRLRPGEKEPPLLRRPPEVLSRKRRR